MWLCETQCFQFITGNECISRYTHTHRHKTLVVKFAFSLFFFKQKIISHGVFYRLNLCLFPLQWILLLDFLILDGKSHHTSHVIHFDTKKNELFVELLSSNSVMVHFTPHTLPPISNRFWLWDKLHWKYSKVCDVVDHFGGHENLHKTYEENKNHLDFLQWHTFAQM